MKLEGNKYFVELDTGAQSYGQVERRQQAYRGVETTLLYVTMSESRLAGLIRHSDAVRKTALFTTLDRVMADPLGMVWVDCSGNQGTILGEA